MCVVQDPFRELAAQDTYPLTNAPCLLVVSAKLAFSERARNVACRWTKVDDKRQGQSLFGVCACVLCIGSKQMIEFSVRRK